MKLFSLWLVFVLSVKLAYADVRMPIGPDGRTSKPDLWANEKRRQEQGFYRMDCKAACVVGGEEEGYKNLGSRWVIRYFEDMEDRMHPKPWEEPRFPYPEWREVSRDVIDISRDTARDFARECEALLCGDISFREYIPIEGFDQDKVVEAMRRAREMKFEAEKAERERHEREQEKRLKEELARKALEFKEGQRVEKEKLDKVEHELHLIQEKRQEVDEKKREVRLNEWEEMRAVPSTPLRAGERGEPQGPIAVPLLN